MTASIPRLDRPEGLQSVHISLTSTSRLHSINNTDPRLTTSQTLRRNSALQNSQHLWKTQTTLQYLPKLSTHPLHALKVDICPLASGNSSTLLASAAPHLSLTPNPSASVLFFLTLKACMTASIPSLDRPEGLQSLHIHSHPHQDYTASTTLSLG